MDTKKKSHLKASDKLLITWKSSHFLHSQHKIWINYFIPSCDKVLHIWILFDQQNECTLKLPYNFVYTHMINKSLDPSILIWSLHERFISIWAMIHSSQCVQTEYKQLFLLNLKNCLLIIFCLRLYDWIITWYNLRTTHYNITHRISITVI